MFDEQTMWPFKKRLVPELEKALPAKQEHGGSSPPEASIVIAGLNAKLQSQKCLIAHLQRCLETKNRELDALHYVWCSGGCESGTHRWSEKNVTEEIVQEAERNTKRLRTWLNSNGYRAAQCRTANR